MTHGGENKSFKKAIYASLSAHLVLFILILASPTLPKSSKRGLTQYYVPINLVAPGGGGGGGGGKQLKETPLPPKKETLRDLTVPSKVKEEAKAAMRYPVEKPKKEPKQKAEKKAAITKPESSLSESAKERAPTDAATGGSGSGGPGMGTGLRIGTGTGSGGSGFGDLSGLSNFPYTYYLQIITDRVSSNWFNSLVDPGVSGNFQTVVYFKISRDGQVSDLKVEESSGITPLDLAAMRAIKASAPFPPLPRDYGEAYLVIHLIFEHSK
jgi:TonB family protein